MGGGGDSPPSQTTLFRPWKAQAPYLKQAYATASDLSQTPMQMYPNEMLAPQDAATTAALGAQEARATAGSDVLRSAQDYNQNVTSGGMLNNNPYIDAAYNQAARGVTRNFNEAVLPALESRFAAAGRIGSGAYGAGLSRATDSLGTSLQDLATNIYGQNYARERGYQDAAAGRAPGLAEADYTDISKLGEVGATREKRAQSLIDELVSRFDFAQQEPTNRLNRFISQIGGPIGGQATAYGNTAVPGNWFNSILGGLFG